MKSLPSPQPPVNSAGSSATASGGQRRYPCINLYAENVVPTQPEFTVSDFIRKAGLHLAWGPPGAFKTYVYLRWIHELLLAQRASHLSGHPDLRINRGYGRVLWIGTEEDTGTLRAKADRVLRGLSVERLGGELVHLWALAEHPRVTLLDLPDILKAEGPFDAVVLDSLTGLRPRTLNGERVRWDLDNDATNEVCLMLRAMTRANALDIHLLHHTGREVQKGYRGPTDWWASADVKIGLVPEGSRVRVVPEKNRDGILLPPFHLTPRFDEDDHTFTLTYAGPGAIRNLTPSAAKADAFVGARGRASQAEIIEGTGLARSTGLLAVKQCVAAGLWRDTGERVNGSPVYAHTQPGAPEGEDAEGAQGAR